MKTLFTLLILIAGFAANAQVFGISNINDLTTMDRYNDSKEIIAGGKVVNTENINGSPYWHPDFVQGKIIDRKSGETLTVFIRYRVFDDIFELKKDQYNPDILYMKRSPQYRIVLNNKHFVFLENLPIKINGANNGYSMILAGEEAKATLYKRMSKDFIPEVEAKSSYSPGKKAELKDKDFYFIEIDGKISQVSPDKKDAPDAFPDKNGQLENYIKENKLKFRKGSEESDLIALVNYYNTL